MTQEEIITRLIDLLELHLQGGFGSVHQERYLQIVQGSLQKRYFESFSTPRLTGDALRGTLQVRWNTANETPRKDLAEAVLTMWDERRYAWDRYP
jgi:hypothetical protein